LDKAEMMSQNKENSNKINLNLLKQLDLPNLFIIFLAFLDAMTTSYGIFNQAVKIPDIPGIILSMLLTGLCLWGVYMSKDYVAPELEKKIAIPLRNFALKVEQRVLLELIADAIAPSIIFIVGIVFLIVDFWTSSEGVGAIIPFTGLLGFVVKNCAVFSLVFSSWYLIYLKPKQVS
jgi:hypothetical protein